MTRLLQTVYVVKHLSESPKPMSKHPFSSCDPEKPFLNMLSNGATGQVDNGFINWEMGTRGEGGTYNLLKYMILFPNG